jgi:hypothetical protein
MKHYSKTAITSSSIGVLLLSSVLIFNIAATSTATAATSPSIISPQPDSATGCTQEPGPVGTTICMNIVGNGQLVEAVDNNIASPTNNVCYSQSYWRGDSVRTGWTDYYSSQAPGCFPFTQTDQAPGSIIGNYVANSNFYGWGRCSLWSSPEWGSAVEESIH